MKKRLENHIETRELAQMQNKFINESSWRFLLWGFVIGAQEIKKISPEEAIRQFFKGKDLPLQETTLQTLLVQWEGFTQTHLYKIYK